MRHFHYCQQGGRRCSAEGKEIFSGSLSGDVYLVPLFMWIAEGHHVSHLAISIESLFTVTESATVALRLEGTFAGHLAQPQLCFTHSFSDRLCFG